MIEKKVHQLKIDKAFKNLIRPLQRKEFLQLEADILENGCREPIVVYDGFIIDGHNRYEICTKHNIPFSIAEMAFECKEEAIAWICAHSIWTVCTAGSRGPVMGRYRSQGYPGSESGKL